MQNWSGLLKWEPYKIFKPSSADEIKTIVTQAIHENKKVRVIGSGHSFTKLCPTDDYMISLDEYQGIISVDKEKLQATVKAGSKLKYLNGLLADHGLASPNMGDIDVQSIAGAISTGTHGTGINLGNLSTQVVAMKFINGLGEEVYCSEEENRELFKAAQVSLGTLGIITEVTLQCIPSYNLELIIERQSLDDILSRYDELNRKNRNFEFFWFPNTPYVMTKTSNVTEAPADKYSWSNAFHEKVTETYAFKLMCELSRMFPSATNRLSNMGGKSITKNRKVNASHKVFSTPRTIRFNEMEYNIPAEAYLDAKKDLVKWVNKNNRTVVFPIENRFVQKDDIYMSPAYERESAYIAVHRYSKSDFREYFTAIEEIFKAYDGRPHWGKMHTLSHQDIQERYPEFDTFKKHRKEQDPNGLYLNPYLEKLLVGESFV